MIIKNFVIALALLGVLAGAGAAAIDLTATCPYDGARAYFAGSKITLKGTSCNYTHQVYDDTTHRNVNHSFWIPATNNRFIGEMKMGETKMQLAIPLTQEQIDAAQEFWDEQ